VWDYLHKRALKPCQNPDTINNGGIKWNRIRQTEHSVLTWSFTMPSRYHKLNPEPPDSINAQIRRPMTAHIPHPLYLLTLR
jgi:hypothetical protein